MSFEMRRRAAQFTHACIHLQAMTVRIVKKQQGQQQQQPVYL
jgi:hypothetical protein